MNTVKTFRVTRRLQKLRRKQRVLRAMRTRPAAYSQRQLREKMRVCAAETRNDYRKAGYKMSACSDIVKAFLGGRNVILQLP
jgi:hypothetical protein